MSIPAPTTVDDLEFMSGTWRCEIWGGTFEETWLEPAAGTMQGCGRHLKNGKTAFMEFMSIETSDSGLTMWMVLGSPSKSQKGGVPFRLTHFDGKSARFENAANDFPNKIVYVKEGKGMSCWIEGLQNGKPLRENFKFKRVR